MIYTKHNDGGCYKMIITYHPSGDVDLTDEREDLRWGDTINELVKLFEKDYEPNFYIQRVIIQDDSK